MENHNNTYCRFCAEVKSPDKIFILVEGEEKYNETLMKLAFLNAIYVDINPQNMLPKTVCFVCYNSLNKAYEFLYNVKKAQELLLTLLVSSNDEKHDVDDDRISLLEEFFASDNVDDIPDVKDESHIDRRVEVKQELKEEVTDGVGNSDKVRGGENDETIINVQDIFNAAIRSNPFSPNVTLFAKELSDISKKSIKSWKDYPWVCAYCNIEFLDLDTLREHSKFVHEKCSAFVCIDCKKYDGMMFEGFNAFIDHVRKHRKGLRSRCEYCDVHIDKAIINGHIKQHYSKLKKQCPHCGEILDNIGSFEKHLQEYRNIKPKRKPRRKRGTPITIEDLTCKLCQKVYKNPNSLRDHVKLHNIDRKRDYTCDRCGKTFFNKGTLTSHIMAHDQIRPHICRICNKSFLFPNMLRRHVLMHSNVKPFSCEQCGRCFRLQYQLNAHKIIHTDAMPYVCTYCNKAFRFKQILKNHERQHTGAKPYSCQQCGMEFTNWSNYNKHMKRRHGTDTSKKKITPDGVFPVNPQTGLIMQVEDPAGTEEWKTRIMIPGKRGKKKVIKQENDVLI